MNATLLAHWPEDHSAFLDGRRLFVPQEDGLRGLDLDTLEEQHYEGVSAEQLLSYVRSPDDSVVAFQVLPHVLVRVT